MLGDPALSQTDGPCHQFPLSHGGGGHLCFHVPTSHASRCPGPGASPRRMAAALPLTPEPAVPPVPSLTTAPACRAADPTPSLFDWKAPEGARNTHPAGVNFRASACKLLKAGLERRWLSPDTGRLYSHQVPGKQGVILSLSLYPLHWSCHTELASRPRPNHKTPVRRGTSSLPPALSCWLG